MRRLLLAVSLLLLFAPAAHAGGWATVSLSSTPKDKNWTVDLTVLQHGRTPLNDLQPVVTIRSGDTIKDFAAKPTGKAGTYRAQVVFPTAGRWTYQIDDGFISQMPHTYPAVQIGEGTAAAGSDGDGGGPNLLWLIPGLVLLAAAAALIIRPRLHGRGEQPQAA